MCIYINIAILKIHSTNHIHKGNKNDLKSCKNEKKNLSQ